MIPQQQKEKSYKQQKDETTYSRGHAVEEEALRVYANGIYSANKIKD